MDRRGWIAGLALAVVFAAIVFWCRGPVDHRPVPPPPRVHRGSPNLPKPAPANVRATLPVPDGIEAPAIPHEAPEPSVITPDDRARMNVVVDDVLQAARTDCLAPWLTHEGDGEPAEFVFDAVLNDGRLVDVGLRSMRLDLPSDVVQCVADRTWYAEWPEWDLAGELRLQRTIEVSPTVDP